MKKFLAIILIATTLLSSCATQSKVQYISCYDEYCQRYIGKSHKQLISDLGAPNRETSDGNEGTIIIYETITEHHKLSSVGNSSVFGTLYSSGHHSGFGTLYSSGHHSGFGTSFSSGRHSGFGHINIDTSGTTTSSVSFLHLYIDSEGVCYNVATNHMQVDWLETAKEEKREKEKDPKKKKTLAIVFGSMAAVFAVACGVGAIAFSR